VIGTSSYLRKYSHGKSMTYIKDTAIEVIRYVKSKGIECRFSTEDSFRSDLVDLLSIYSVVSKEGVDRVGIADTVGCATPRQVYDLVRTLRGVVSCEIEAHFHDDTGCEFLRSSALRRKTNTDSGSVANAYMALSAGANLIDTFAILHRFEDLKLTFLQERFRHWLVEQTTRHAEANSIQAREMVLRHWERK
jgi:homocitrate synthase